MLAWKGSVQDGIVALWKVHKRSAPSLSSLPTITLETVPMFAWLNIISSPISEGGIYWLQAFSPPLSFRWSMLWCSGLSMFRKFLKPRSTSALPSCRPDVIFAVLASLSACSFPLTPACSRQQIHRSLCIRRLRMAVCQSGQPIPAPPSAAGSSSLWEWWHVKSLRHVERLATVLHVWRLLPPWSWLRGLHCLRV